jgi:ABC-type transporter MlaC component
MPISQIHRSPLLGPLLAVALAVGYVTPIAAHERPATAPAARFLQATIDNALPLAMPPVSNAADARLRTTMDNALDFPGLTIFALGRYRAALDAEAVARAQGAIGEQLRALAYRAGEAYPTLALTVTGLRIDADGNRRIQSVVRLPKIGEVEVEWILKPDDGSYRILDIQAFGLTLRHFLRNWIAVVVAEADPATVFGPTGVASPE